MWFRSDLRTVDNTALHHAASSPGGVVGVFAVTPEQWKQHDWGVTKADFVMRSAEWLREELAKLNIALRIVRMPTFAAVPQQLLKLAKSLRCGSLFFNREYEVNERRRDAAATELFESAGLTVRSFDDQTILPPDLLRTGEGNYYTVYSPFKRAWSKAVSQREPLAMHGRPRRQPGAAVKSDQLPRVTEFGKPTVPPELWPAGEREALRRFDRFIAQRIAAYDTAREFPATEGTSQLSAYLACGAISPRQCYAAAREAGRGEGPATWMGELIWREFYRHVLVGFPRVSMNRAFKVDADAGVRWRYDEGDFARWCEGATGVPIVDAAMRQMRQIGWMHNRLRMITAMYLTKDLLIDWRWGERYFMQHLVDGDLANNNGGWQWAASTGTDAVPYFRVFNPVSQSRRFDPQGAFIRRFCPELAKLDDKSIHDPPPLLRGAIGWPEPMVEHGKARLRAIAAFKR